MPQISDLSLHSINYNNYLATNCHNELVPMMSTKSTDKSNLWTLSCGLSLWKLIHQICAMCFTFDRSKYKGSTSNRSLFVKHGEWHLRLRMIVAASPAANDKFRLELLVKNGFNSKTLPILFIYQMSKQIFHDIDSYFFRSYPVSTEIISVNAVRNDYDYVVVGSSFCSLAFIDRTLQNNPKAKVLVLEKGSKYLSEHHQHCPSPLSAREVEVRPWTISTETIQNEFVQNVHGQIPFLGGRSTYWSGWCPTPSIKELAGWPEDLSITLQKTYFDLATKFLGVIPANNMNVQDNKECYYDTFQSCLKEYLDTATNIESVEQVFHAPLAMGNNR